MATSSRKTESPSPQGTAEIRGIHNREDFPITIACGSWTDRRKTNTGSPQTTTEIRDIHKREDFPSTCRTSPMQSWTDFHAHFGKFVEKNERLASDLKMTPDIKRSDNFLSSPSNSSDLSGSGSSAEKGRKRYREECLDSTCSPTTSSPWVYDASPDQADSQRSLVLSGKFVFPRKINLISYIYIYLF